MPTPGVILNERSQVPYVPQIATTIFGIVGTASKGPIETVTDITDEASLVATFGPPSANHMAIYAAIRYLKKGQQLKFVRVAHYDATAVGSIYNAANTNIAVAVSALSSGSWGNNISLVVANGTDAGTYKITVLESGTVRETYDLLKVGLVNVNSSNYIGTRINGVSDYISVTPDTSESTLLVSATTVVMTGGDDGAPATTADYIGTVGTPPTIPATGLQLFANPKTVSVNAIAVPGVTYEAVIAAEIVLCESRKDCMCLLDVPYGKTVTEAVAWSNGLGGGPDDPTSAITSSYAAMFYSWVQIYDGYNDADTWIPPCGDVAGAFAYTDRTEAPWFAPVGATRGRLSDVLDVEYSPTDAEIAYMYTNGNSVNPIVNFTGRGIMLWGQRTAQRDEEPTSRINVRRLQIVIRKALSDALEGLIWEPNNPSTQARLRVIVNPIMSLIQAGQGVSNYSLVCDATNNTTVTIARRELHASLSYIPIEAIEEIVMDLSIVNNQAQFTTI